MFLEPGSRLAQYEILEKLGTGGVGEVYAASDTMLGRKVALRILPPGMASHERRSRFEQEAKAIAALNHPNIVQVYAVEESGGVPFVVMELVTGRTLAEIVPDKGLPLERFLEIAVPLTEAVAAAHERGITHRDLKPENIKVSTDGKVKVLDFGVAEPRSELMGSDRRHQEPRSATREGQILGTVAHMSPEQMEGKPAGPTSDVFTLGLIFYQMVTGRHPFPGNGPASILSAILKDSPKSVTDWNRAVSPMLARIIRRCLAKDPKRRYQNALALRNELEELEKEVESGGPWMGRTGAGRFRGHRFSFVRVGAGLLLLGMGGYLLFKREPGRNPAAGLVDGTFTQITNRLGLELFPSLAPEGDFVVYASDASGDWDIYLQRVGGERIINLTERSDAEDTQPAFSPDGEQIAFRSERNGGGIFVMGATGEAAKRVADFGYYPAWSPDGRRVAITTQKITDPRIRSGESSLWVVSLDSGDTRLLTGGDAAQPHWSPQGHRIAYWGVDQGGHRDLWTIDAEGGEAVAVTNDAPLDWSPAWSPDGSYLYFSSDRGGNMNLWRVPIDERTGRLRGDFEPVTTGATAVAQHLRFSGDGRRLVYSSLLITQNLWKLGFDPSEEAIVGEPVPVTRGSEPFYHPQISPDGERIALVANNEDLFVLRSDGTGLRRLSDDGHQNREPRWAPDGERIVFQSDRTGSYDIWTINYDGSGLTQLTNTPDLTLLSAHWSPEGDTIACWNVSDDSILFFDPNVPWNQQKPKEVETGHGAKRFSPWSWSPDGRWLAGDWSHVTGEFIGIVIYSLVSGELMTLTDFGSRPVWLSDSRRLLFLGDEDELYLLDSETRDYRRVQDAPPMGVVQVAPDDRTIYYTHRVEEADIWMLSMGRDDN